jgi:hypothetical protein
MNLVRDRKFILPGAQTYYSNDIMRFNNSHDILKVGLGNTKQLVKKYFLSILNLNWSGGN